MAGANISARMLTNPKFVNWLAGTTKVKDPAPHIARLITIYNSTDDEALKSDLGQYISSLNGEQ